ncbi:NmrA family NAD(P)-binding protein [Robbsia andropogonis]|uniref:NmrA family NAD(P)-binding protein n=1 Tax=Robbsia andropogonis TaxID=28092 RepID=UPI003D1CAFBC
MLRPKADDATDSKAATLRAMDLGIVQADLAAETEKNLSTIFSAFSTVICCTGFVGGPGTQRKITAAVLNAGVARYVPWQFGVDYDIVGRDSGQDVFDEQADVRDMLRAQSSTRWISASTGMFTSFLFEPSFGVVDFEAGSVRALGSWDTVTVPKDIGCMIAAILAHQPSLNDTIVYVAGHTVSYAELADMVDVHLGRRTDRVLRDFKSLRAQVAERPGDGMCKYRLAFARDTGVAWDMACTFNAAENIAVTDVPTWLRQNKR